MRLREDLAEEYRRMIDAETYALVDQARTRFMKKWRLRCPAVVGCLEKAGDDLFTFSPLAEDAMEGAPDDQCPRADQRRFRRRTRTQASPLCQDAVLLFGLLRSGHVKPENRRLGRDATRREGGKLIAQSRTMTRSDFSTT